MQILTLVARPLSEKTADSEASMKSSVWIEDVAGIRTTEVVKGHGATT